MTLQVEVVSPERIIYSGEAEMVIARSAGGDIAFLTGHAPFVGALGIGQVRVRASGGSDEVAAVHGGFVQVKDDNVIILSDVAELAEDIDVERAREAKRRAEEQVRSGGGEEAEAALRRAEVRLETAGK